MEPKPRKHLPPLLPPHKRKARDETFGFLRSSLPPMPPKSRPLPSNPQRMPPIKPSKSIVSPPAHGPSKAVVLPPARGPNSKAVVPPPAHGPPPFNKTLLAGYLAHEYLTRGTLCGQPFDPSQQNAPATSSSADPGPKPNHDYSIKAKGKAVEPMMKPDAKPSKKDAIQESEVAKVQRYVNVSEMIIKDGVHIPGIVNPSQLARFLNI